MRLNLESIAAICVPMRKSIRPKWQRQTRRLLIQKMQRWFFKSLFCVAADNLATFFAIFFKHYLGLLFLLVIGNFYKRIDIKSQGIWNSLFEILIVNSKSDLRSLIFFHFFLWLLISCQILIRTKYVVWKKFEKKNQPFQINLILNSRFLLSFT